MIGILKLKDPSSLRTPACLSSPISLPHLSTSFSLISSPISATAVTIMCKDLSYVSFFHLYWSLVMLNMKWSLNAAANLSQHLSLSNPQPLSASNTPQPLPPLGIFPFRIAAIIILKEVKKITKLVVEGLHLCPLYLKPL